MTTARAQLYQRGRELELGVYPIVRVMLYADSGLCLVDARYGEPGPDSVFVEHDCILSRLIYVWEDGWWADVSDQMTPWPVQGGSTVDVDLGHVWTNAALAERVRR